MLLMLPVYLILLKFKAERSERARNIGVSKMLSAQNSVKSFASPKSLK